jgi:hypothetical protein
MVEQLGAINDRLNNDLVGIRQDYSSLKSSYSDLNEKYSLQSSECEILKKQVSSLESEIARLRVGRVSGKEEDIGTSGYDTDEGIQGVEDFIEPDDSSDAFFGLEEKNDYDESEVIPITPASNEIGRQSHVFANLISGFFDKGYSMKRQGEQDNLIFKKLMEHDYSQNTVRIVGDTLRKYTNIPRLDLYKLVSRNASDDELEQFCKSYTT